jgi:SAM-dependent methyltransferase
MSFGAIAADYDRLRPSPPDAAVDWLLPAGCQVAVDVGAGTGKLSRALASRVPRVIAVEPDERMRAVLRARSPGVEAVAGRGEAIPLPDASADAVLVSSAWQWMNPELTVPEIGRVLHDGGRFGVIWTSRDREADWLRDLSQSDAPPGLRRREVELPDGAPMTGAATATFAFSQAMSIADIVGLQGTYSELIIASRADRDAKLASVAAFLEQRFPGATEVDVPLRSWCWRADRTARAACGRAQRHST